MKKILIFVMIFLILSTFVSQVKAQQPPGQPYDSSARLEGEVRIALDDPFVHPPPLTAAHRTKQALDALGIPYHDITGTLSDADLSQYDILIIGNCANSYSTEVSTLGNSEKIRQFIYEGGVVISFIQDNGGPLSGPVGRPFTWVPYPVLQLSPNSDDFLGLQIMDSNHPIFQGLQKDDFIDWTYILENGKTYRYVTWDAIRSVDARWRVLARTGDGKYIAIAESNYGAGRCLIVQVHCDAPVYNQVPAANKLFNNIIRYAESVYITNDLYVLSVTPIQVIWEASALVANKSTLVKVEVGSRFQDNKTTQIKLTFDDKVYQENVEIRGMSLTTLYLPPSAPILPKNTGAITISAEIDPNNNIPEPNEMNNVKSISIAVKDTRGLKLLYVPVGYVWDTPINTEEMLIMGAESSAFIKATYPIADDELVYKIKTIRFVPPIPPIPILEIEYIILQLSEMAWFGYDRVVGITPTGWLDPHTPFKKGEVGISMDSMPGVLVDNGYWSTPAHEIAHTYGIELEEYDTNWPGNEANGYWVHKREQVINGFCFMGTAIYQNFVLMPLNRHVWVDNIHYEYLLKKFKSDPDPEVLGISGFMFRNGTVVLRPWYHLPYGTPDLMPGSRGNYSLVSLDAGGQVLQQVGFNVTFPAGYNASVFAFRIPFAPNTAQIQIQNERGKQLASRKVSANPPIVTLTFPQGGEFLGPRNYTVTWEAYDRDGEKLTYTVLYSIDGGYSWIPLVFGLNETKYVLDVSKFFEDSSYLIKIIASDGINTAEDISDHTFAIDLTPPTVKIMAPSNGSYVVSFLTYISFSARDDNLANATLQINNNIFDVTGLESYRLPFLLFGYHKVKIIGMDKAGNESSAIIYITSLDWLLVLVPLVAIFFFRFQKGRKTKVLIELEDRMKKLDEVFKRGEISRDTYIKLKTELEEQLKKERGGE